MWSIEPGDLYLRRHREFEARRDGVLLALLSNLEAYLQALNSGQNPMNIRGGFLHPERYYGMAAVDARGAATKCPAARLYFFADVETHVLHLLSIGLKNTQPEDLKACRRLVDGIRKGKING